MADDLLKVLTEFHRTVVVPDIERIVDQRISGVEGKIGSLRNEMLSHFEAIYKRLDRLVTMTAV